MFLVCKFSRKDLLNFRNASVSHCFRNSSLAIIWNNLGLSYYKRIKRNLEDEKSNSKNLIRKGCFQMTPNPSQSPEDSLKKIKTKG